MRNVALHSTRVRDLRTKSGIRGRVRHGVTSGVNKMFQMPVSENNTPTENERHWDISFQSTKSAAGELFRAPPAVQRGAIRRARSCRRASVGRGDDAVGNPHRAQIVQVELFELKFINSSFSSSSSG